MNVFRQIKKTIDGRRRERLKGDIMAILKTEYGFDAMAHLIPESISNAAYEQDKVVENLVWYSAKEVALIEYYKSGTGSSLKNRELGELRNFWSTAPGKSEGCIRESHARFPKSRRRSFSGTVIRSRRQPSRKRTERSPTVSTRKPPSTVRRFSISFNPRSN